MIAFFHNYYYSAYKYAWKELFAVIKKLNTPTKSGSMSRVLSVQGIIKHARGNLTQQRFVDLLKAEHKVITSQGLVSKYERGKATPSVEFINVCLEIIHDENIEGDVSLKELGARLKKSLSGPSQAGARKAFAMLLDSLAH